MPASIYSVKQINRYIRDMFMQDFLLSSLSVRGELSSLKFHPSGHVYFTLKDEDAILSGVMFKSDRLSGLKGDIKEGMKVVVKGRISVYEASGKYELYAKSISIDGEGEEYLRFLELKEKLDKEGLFQKEHKKPIPQYALTVGIVSSISGAGFRDIEKIAKKRNPYVQLLISDALVQGENAPDSIVKAIKKMDAYHPDVMIVGRGGGAKEDLYCFNDERVARAIYACETPVISAVGHEVDVTIADFVADKRAATPSEAAEIAVFLYDHYKEQVDELLQKSQKLIAMELKNYRSILERQRLNLQVLHPKNQLKEHRQKLLDLKRELENSVDLLLQDYRKRFMDLDLRLNTSIEDLLMDRRHTLQLMAERLNGRSPLNKLVNGYGYVSSKEKPLSNASDIQVGDTVSVTLHDGKLECEVKEIQELHYGRKESID